MVPIPKLQFPNPSKHPNKICLDRERVSNTLLPDSQIHSPFPNHQKYSEYSNWGKIPKYLDEAEIWSRSILAKYPTGHNLTTISLPRWVTKYTIPQFLLVLCISHLACVCNSTSRFLPHNKKKVDINQFIVHSCYLWNVSKKLYGPPRKNFTS